MPCFGKFSHPAVIAQISDQRGRGERQVQVMKNEHLRRTDDVERNRTVVGLHSFAIVS